MGVRVNIVVKVERRVGEWESGWGLRWRREWNSVKKMGKREGGMEMEVKNESEDDRSEGDEVVVEEKTIMEMEVIVGMRMWVKVGWKYGWK
jgi:hypothetical protein